MEHNEFRRLLIMKEIPEQLQVPLMLLFEQQAEVGKQLDLCASTIAALAETVGSVVELSKVTNERLKTLAKIKDVPGVDVRSEGVG